MKKIIRIVVGSIFFAVGIFFAVAATTAWLQGQALHVGFGALCGSVSFIVAGFMTIGEDAWRDIAELLFSLWWL